MTFPWDSVWTDGVDVNKGTGRQTAKDRLVTAVATPAELNSMTTGGARSFYVRSLSARFEVDLDDTTSSDDGNDVLESADGYRYKKVLAPLSQQNLITNGQFRIGQRGTSFTSATTPANNDDTVTLDRWILLSDGDDVVDVDRVTNIVPDGAYSSVLLTVQTANKRAGLCQIFEAKDAAVLIGSRASLLLSALRFSTNATVDKFRVVIASWTGTEDAPTTDIVSAWGTEGNNPTLAANWTIEGSAVFSLSGTSFEDFALPNVAIDTASPKNVAVLIMIENDDATVADKVLFTNVDLREGAQAADRYVAPPIHVELDACERFYIVADLGLVGYATAGTTSIRVSSRLSKKMRTSPTIALLDDSISILGAASSAQTSSGSSIIGSSISDSGFRVAINGFPTLTIGEVVMILQSTPVLAFDAEF